MSLKPEYNRINCLLLPIFHDLRKADSPQFLFEVDTQQHFCRFTFNISRKIVSENVCSALKCLSLVVHPHTPHQTMWLSVRILWPANAIMCFLCSFCNMHAFLSFFFFFFSWRVSLLRIFDFLQFQFCAIPLTVERCRARLDKVCLLNAPGCSAPSLQSSFCSWCMTRKGWEIKVNHGVARCRRTPTLRSAVLWALRVAAAPHSSV